MATSATKQRVIKESALLSCLLFVGIVVVPIAIYFVGQAVFGDYAGHGYGDFFGTLMSKLRNGSLDAWYLVLSPYIGWQLLRVLALAWRKTRTDD